MFHTFFNGKTAQTHLKLLPDMKQSCSYLKIGYHSPVLEVKTCCIVLSPVLIQESEIVLVFSHTEGKFY